MIVMRGYRAAYVKLIFLGVNVISEAVDEVFVETVGIPNQQNSTLLV